MVGRHRQLNGHEFEQAPGDGEGQGRLTCFSPWGHRESDMTEPLNNNNHGKSTGGGRRAKVGRLVKRLVWYRWGQLGLE